MALALALPLAAAAQPARAPTMTRLVKVFLDLETQLAQAEQAGDIVALERLTTEDFELRVARRPGTPVARAEWLAALARQRAGEASLEQMAVHDHGSIADVSFLVRPAAGAPRLVVDSWTRVGDGWRLAVRYAAPVMSDAAPVPGEATDVEVEKK
jgi:hypothetical protein